MFTLPDVPGRYPVGATTFAVSVGVADPADRVLGEHPRLKASSGGGANEPALKLEEVAFTVFYPARIGESSGKTLRKGLAWIPRYARSGPKSGCLLTVCIAPQTRQRSVARLRSFRQMEFLVGQLFLASSCAPCQGTPRS